MPIVGDNRFPDYTQQPEGDCRSPLHIAIELYGCHRARGAWQLAGAAHIVRTRRGDV